MSRSFADRLVCPPAESPTPWVHISQTSIAPCHRLFTTGDCTSRPITTKPRWILVKRVKGASTFELLHRLVAFPCIETYKSADFDKRQNTTAHEVAYASNAAFEMRGDASLGFPFLCRVVMVSIDFVHCFFRLAAFINARKPGSSKT